MAVEMFLEIEGVEGESHVKGFENKIDIFSFSFGASNPHQGHIGGGSGAGKVDLSDLSVHKTLDKATPKLFLQCCSGKHFTKAKLTVRESGGDAPVDYLVVDLTEVFISSVSWSGAHGGGKPGESLALNYSSIVLNYTPQDKDGKAGTKIPAGWDIKKNVKL